MLKLWKACQNDSCDYKHHRIKCSVTDKYCTKCGSQLAHVCYRCGAVLEGDLEKLCSQCIQQAAEKKQAAAENRKRVRDEAAAHAVHFAVEQAPAALDYAKKKGPELVQKAVKLVARAPK